MPRQIPSDQLTVTVRQVTKLPGGIYDIELAAVGGQVTHMIIPQRLADITSVTLSAQAAAALQTPPEQLGFG